MAPQTEHPQQKRMKTMANEQQQAQGTQVSKVIDKQNQVQNQIQFFESALEMKENEEIFADALDDAKAQYLDPVQKKLKEKMYECAKAYDLKIDEDTSPDELSLMVTRSIKIKREKLSKEFYRSRTAANRFEDCSDGFMKRLHKLLDIK